MIGPIKLAAIATVYAYDVMWLAIAPAPLSDTFWVAFWTGLPATIAATGALIVGVRNSKKQEAATAKQEADGKEADKKANTIIEKATEIHTLTNSYLSKVTAELAQVRSENAGLERLVLSMIESREATLAASNLAETATEARAAESAIVSAAASMSVPPQERKLP